MKLPIVIIGSSNTSKTSTGNLLAQQLNLPFISLGDISEKYFLEIDFDKAQQEQALEENGGDGYYRYMMPFNAYAIERALSENKKSVIEFSPEQSVYDDSQLLEKIEQILQPLSHVILLAYSPDMEESSRVADFARASELLSLYENVVLLLPSPDLDESVEILKHRNEITINGVEINRFFMIHPSNQKLAKQIIYTKGKTAEEIKEEILCS